MIEYSCCIRLNLKQKCADREGKIIKIDFDDLSFVEVELLDRLFMNLNWSRSLQEAQK